MAASKAISSFYLSFLTLGLLQRSPAAANFATEASYVQRGPQRTFPAEAAETGTPQNVEEDAGRLRHRLESLNKEIADVGERIRANFVFNYGGAAEISNRKPGSKEAINASRAAAAYLKSATRRESELVFEAAILSDELDRYHRTGVLSAPDDARVKWIKEQLAHPFRIFPVGASDFSPELSLDINVLQRQLYYYDHLLGNEQGIQTPSNNNSPPVNDRVSPSKRRNEAVLLKTAPTIRAPVRDRPKTSVIEYARDAGTGKAVIDPIPALINQLSSTSAVERALAADELAHQWDISQAIPAILRAITDEDPRVRASAALALGAAAPQEAVIRALKKTLNDHDADVRFSAQKSLLQLAH